MATLKITSWNVEHLDRLVEATSRTAPRRDAVVREIRELNPDILCLLEGPRGEERIRTVCAELLNDDWVPVTVSDGKYGMQGSQWIWFLVRPVLADKAALAPFGTWDTLTYPTWECFRWGEFEAMNHRHYRHPQVLVLDWNGMPVEFIGLHLKSKYVNQGKSMWDAAGDRRNAFIREALSARMKLTTEATNVRCYIDAKFRQMENPAIFVLGDLNDGPGKEYFEDRFLFFDLISNIQGDIFSASRYLYHALFDFPDQLRWTVRFTDFVEPERDPHILLDHIMFTQGLTNGSLPWKIHAKAGLVEHEVHELVNAPLPQSQHTSDHRPVSVTVTVDG